LLRGRDFHYWLVLAVIGWTPAPTWADEIEVRNGDRLTGEVVKMEDNILTLNTKYGEMKIDWAKVVRLRSTKPMRVKVPSEQKGVVTDFFLGGYELRHVTELSQDGPIALSQVKGINIGRIRHDGPVTVGGNHTSGNTNTKAVNAIGRATLQAHRRRLYVEAKYNYGEANGGVTTRNWSGQLKYDYFISDKVFLNNVGMLEHDRFQHLQLRTTVGAGAGYQFLSTNRTTLSGTLGMGYVNEDYTTLRRTETPSLHCAYRLEHTVLPRIKLFQRFDGFYDLKAANAVRITTDQGVRVTVYQTLYVSSEYDYRLNTVPAPGRKKVDDAYYSAWALDSSVGQRPPLSCCHGHL
jgi:putative salt-induced outer membrane protein YdiY